MKTNWLKIGIAVLAFLSAGIHISLGEPLFILNGVGTLALLAAYLLPVPSFQSRKSLLRWLLGGFIAVTIVLYFLAHPEGAWQQDGLGVFTKFVEVLLLLLLVYDGQQP